MNHKCVVKKGRIYDQSAVQTLYASQESRQSVKGVEAKPTRPKQRPRLVTGWMAFLERIMICESYSASECDLKAKRTIDASTHSGQSRLS